eukprot:TRINITY_DN15246_c0_g1_i5.p1 TRINITY_DN15246_c0_g1~~TRINITY_DN15246_c0_g1_i5.p1  ORF type:complete len:638 (+),score=69.83 TRINITY_DN15246_c0_g1_i5:150-2063(+)
MNRGPTTPTGAVWTKAALAEQVRRRLQDDGSSAPVRREVVGVAAVAMQGPAINQVVGAAPRIRGDWTGALEVHPQQLPSQWSSVSGSSACSVSPGSLPWTGAAAGQTSKLSPRFASVTPTFRRSCASSTGFAPNGSVNGFSPTCARGSVASPQPTLRALSMSPQLANRVNHGPFESTCVTQTSTSSGSPSRLFSPATSDYVSGGVAPTPTDEPTKVGSPTKASSVSLVPVGTLTTCSQRVLASAPGSPPSSSKVALCSSPRFLVTSTVRPAAPAVSAAPASPSSRLRGYVAPAQPSASQLVNGFGKPRVLFGPTQTFLAPMATCRVAGVSATSPSVSPGSAATAGTGTITRMTSMPLLGNMYSPPTSTRVPQQLPTSPTAKTPPKPLPTPQEPRAGGVVIRRPRHTEPPPSSVVANLKFRETESRTLSNEGSTGTAATLSPPMPRAANVQATWHELPPPGNEEPSMLNRSVPIVGGDVQPCYRLQSLRAGYVARPSLAAAGVGQGSSTTLLPASPSPSLGAVETLPRTPLQLPFPQLGKPDHFLADQRIADGERTRSPTPPRAFFDADDLSEEDMTLPPPSRTAASTAEHAAWPWPFLTEDGSTDSNLTGQHKLCSEPATPGSTQADLPTVGKIPSR